MHLIDHTSRWLAFVAVAIAMSYALRWLAARAVKAGERGVAAARRTLGLAERAAARDLRSHGADDPADGGGGGKRRAVRP